MEIEEKPPVRRRRKNWAEYFDGQWRRAKPVDDFDRAETFRSNAYQFVAKRPGWRVETVMDGEDVVFRFIEEGE